MNASPPSVLIVDDDPTLLRLLGILLREEGYRVLSADGAERALALLAAEKPNLLLTDLRMGSMDGLALFDAVRRTYPMLPVIILTAHGTIPEAVEATRRGVFGFITKPYEAQALLAEVRKALAADASSPDLTESQIVTRSPLMLSVLDEARIVAATDASVLIFGDTGSGKELLAQTLHDWSPRRDAAFVAINCGAIPEQLLESELFGHVKGSFTGATRDHRGLFQEAVGGTVFLDEIGDMPLSLQVKLLRVLQEREVRPVGAARSVPVDVRIVSATHRDLDAEIAAGRFREDLYYRVNVVNLNLPPLAERREDIPLLAQHFLAALAEKYRKKVNGYASDAMEVLLKAAWPGNVRQLFNVVEKCVALSTTPIVPLALVERALNRPGEDMGSFDEARRAFERDYLVQLLKMSAGNVTHAARIAKRNRSDFYTLLNRHQIDPSRFKA
ncbi:MAG: sigma 54-interacting transcriptional regulator [Burkholderiales bacterium]|nr:sigma 54-interacting transcriptional regulator [Zoogloeaceae bacterium]MBV6410444.1 Transcriptional regulatory protein GlrR [Rhodocyclaceae bacterium]MCZ2174619.1 sigma 54-interacting transcriptional regulator [Burkholderiales bacterium]HNQ58172.1 sigma 54-interacting transcriptional regulator [Candidatus Desulfobacillus denitrificans]MCC7270152.1 sigma 54-interacting transcriptional regulator [Rhodocyclaceae bacterium]